MASERDTNNRFPTSAKRLKKAIGDRFRRNPDKVDSTVSSGKVAPGTRLEHAVVWRYPPFAFDTTHDRDGWESKVADDMYTLITKLTPTPLICNINTHTPEDWVHPIINHPVAEVFFVHEDTNRVSV